MPDDYSSTTQTTGTVAVGGSATGEIETSKDFDWFAVDLVAGHTYVIDLEGTDSGGGALRNPVLRGLYDADGNRIAGTRDNDGGTGRDARLTFTATTTGTYYIEARGHSNQTGDYTVRVTEWVDTDAERGGAADLGDITAAGPQFPAASLDGSSDSVDYWRFTLSEARRVGVGLRQQDANADLFLEDAEGNVLYSSTEDGTANEWISQTLLAGTYFVRVEAQEEGANEFKLRYGVSAANPDVVAALEQQQEGTDEAPAFAEGSYAFDLAENADGGAIRVALGAVSAADPEKSTITYSIEAGDSGGLFAIDSETGALSYQGAGEDYESGTTSYELTVRASDGSLHSEVTVTVNVTDVQEAPAFAETSYAFSLAENADGGTIRVALGAVTATDPDNDTVAYSIEGGNESGSFEIDAASGELFYVGAGEDYEAGAAQFDLTIRASDGTLTADAAVSVAITDVPEQTIVVPADPENLQNVSEPYGEDLPTNTSTIGRVAVGGTATGNIGRSGDRDGFAVELVAGRTYIIDLRGSPTGDGTLNDPYLRGIKGPDGSRIAGVSNDDGGEGYNSQLNFTPTESGTHYIIAGAYSGLGTYEVEVRDVSPQTAQQETVNGPPAFGEGSYAFSLAENVDGGTSSVALGAVSATDPEDSTITYSIEAGDSGGLFAIDSGTGTLSYQGAGEDYESGTTSYELTVRASDGSLHSDVTVAVNVTDVEEYVILEQGANEAPAFGQENYAFSLTENAGGDTIRLSLGVVQATDPDDDPVAYSIEAGNPDGLFAIDATTGELSYQGAGEDYESGTTSYELTVRASDGTGHSDVVVTVNVADVADEEEYVALEQGITTDVSEPDDSDFPATTSTTGAVTVGGEVIGKIGAADDHDWFAVTLEADKTYRIDLRGSWTGNGTLWNPFLRGIHDSTGVLVAGTTNDDGGTNHNARVYFDCDTAGTYYLAAGGYGTSQGTYTLSVADVTDGEPDDFSAGTDTTGAVDVGGSVSGHLELWHDRDWFAVELEAGRFYSIALKGSWTGDNTLYDPVLRAIYDTDGNRVASAGGHWGGDRIATFAPVDGGTYYVEAGGGGDDEGAYTLSVTDVTHRISDDFEAGTGTTGRVEVGGSARGEIDYIGDRDWFAVELMAGNTYRFDQEHPPNVLYDPILRGIHDADGNFIAGTKDSSGSLGDSRVFFTPEDTGTYYVAAGAAADTTGSYTLSVINYSSVGDDYTAGTGTSGAVAVGGSATGRINYADDRDWFAVELEAGKSYQIDMRGWTSGHGTLYGPKLIGIHDAAGDLIHGTWARDGGVGVYPNSRVTFTATNDGTYYVEAAGNKNQTGTYTLSVKHLTDDYAAGTDTTGTVDVGGSVMGKIEIPNDRDWFAVELDAGKTYRIDMKGSETGHGTLYNPNLYGVRDAAGDLIPGTSTNELDWVHNSRVTFTAEDDGTYYVEAGAADVWLSGGWQGTYALSVEEVM